MIARTAAIVSGLLAVCPAMAQSQGQMDSVAATDWNQVMADNVPECGMNGSGTGAKGSGTCVPITLAPGDVTPGSGTSVKDAQGNTWSLACDPGGEDGNGCWYGGLVFNGQQVSNGYVVGLRAVNGTVYAEQAKGAGWQIADASNPGNAGNQWTYVSDPGGGTQSAREADTATPAAPMSGPDLAAAEAAGQMVDQAANAAASSVISCYEQKLGTSNNQMLSEGQAAPKPVSSQRINQQASDAMTSDVMEAAIAQQSICPVPNEVVPGIGSIIDASGQVFTVDPQSGNQVMVNGQAATPDGTGTGTSAVTSVDGAIYGQDENTHQWFRLNGQYWTPLTALPASGQTPTPTDRWTTPNNT